MPVHLRHGFQFRGGAAGGKLPVPSSNKATSELRMNFDPLLFAVFQHVFGPAIAHAAGAFWTLTISTITTRLDQRTLLP